MREKPHGEETVPEHRWRATRCAVAQQGADMTEEAAYWIVKTGPDWIVHRPGEPPLASYPTLQEAQKDAARRVSESGGTVRVATEEPVTESLHMDSESPKGVHKTKG
jgi:hypothetical protein